MVVNAGMLANYSFWQLADLGKARGCSTNTSVINSLTHPLVKVFLRRRHAVMVDDGAFSHKTDYVPIF